MGTVTGSAAANVVITGSFTIPLMKRVGYQPHQAAAVEASASTGGQIMPPIMGAAAFLLAGITGIPYVKVMIASVIPAVAYFVAVGIYTELRARQLNIHSEFREVNFREMLEGLPVFFIPLGILIVLLLQGHTPMYCSFFTILCLLALTFLQGFIKKEWPSLGRLATAVANGARGGAEIAVTIATIGVLYGILLMTGAGLKLSELIETLSLGYLWLGAIVTMVICLILGMGLPTSAAYLLVAIVGAPVLQKSGVGLLPAHLFIFYFAVLSCVTPPVALAALVASTIAGSNYLKTAVEASKICAPGIIIPYMFLVNPTLLLQFPGAVCGALTIIALLLLLLALPAAMVGYLVTRLNPAERILFALAAAAALGYAVTLGYVWLVAGAGLFVILSLWQMTKAGLFKPKLVAERS